jgi:hypothetical protein
MEICPKAEATKKKKSRRGANHNRVAAVLGKIFGPNFVGIFSLQNQSVMKLL